MSTASVTRSHYWADDSIELEPLLANRRWVVGTEPFLHARARNVLRPNAYRAVDRAFRRLLAQGTSDERGPRFSRAMPGYDAYGVNFGPDLTGPFRLFTSRAWHDMFARIFNVPATGHVMCGVHHHAVGSANGRVHNDLNPGWFSGDVAPGEIGLAQHDLLSYATGEAKQEGAEPRECVRAVAILFYLANPPWTPGDGGETGLYRYASDDVLHPEVAIPPINNSLLAFECTPWSFHSFLTNRRSPRNSLVMWIHRTRADADVRFGSTSVVDWPRKRP